VVLGMAGQALGWESVVALRLFTTALSLLCVLVFFSLARQADAGHAEERSAQFLFLPFLFPFFFLIYTDVLSLLLVLGMVGASLHRRYWLSGALGVLACLVRQNNILWVEFVAVLTYVQERGWSWPGWEDARRYAVHLLAGALFIVFLIINKGVSLGDNAAHPSFSLHTGNVFFLLFLACFLFLPVILARRAELAVALRRKEVLAGLLAVTVVFLFTFRSTHGYNVQWGDYFLRNKLLIFFTATLWLKLLFLVPVLVMVGYLCVVRLPAGWWLLYPASVLFLLPSWLVEQRYYFIPLALFLAVREREEQRWEAAQITYAACWSLVLLWLISSTRYFL
jgi:alpha-1,2-glucosyltransferase